MKKISFFSIGLVSLMLFGACGGKEVTQEVSKASVESIEQVSSTDSSSEKEEKKNIENSESDVSEESKETEKNDGKEYMSEYDDDLERYIEENKGFALGTLDEDGNPTENGTPNPEFANWIYVQDIKITTDKQIDVNITEDFKSLSKSEKDNLASSIQGVVMMFTEAQDANDRYHIYFYNGGNTLGGSKVLQSNEYKWYN